MWPEWCGVICNTLINFPMNFDYLFDYLFYQFSVSFSLHVHVLLIFPFGIDCIIEFNVSYNRYK